MHRTITGILSLYLFPALAATALAQTAATSSSTANCGPLGLNTSPAAPGLNSSSCGGVLDNGTNGVFEAAVSTVIAGYISYAFHRVGEVTETLAGIDTIMGAGFNWAPPGVLVDTMGPASAVELIEGAGLPVPEAISKAAASGEPARFFTNATVNTGKYFVAG